MDREVIGGPALAPYGGGGSASGPGSAATMSRVDAPTILLDMDGPLAGFEEALWDRCLEEGIRFDISDPGEQQHRYSTDHIANRSERARARAIVNAGGWFADLPVVPGAVEGVAALEALGVDLWVCTKPLDANPTCRDDKAAWLARHLPQLADRLIIAPDKSRIIGDLLLDDAPKVHWLARAQWVPVMFPTSYNGPGTPWGHLARWGWDDDPAELVALARSSKAWSE